MSTQKGATMRNYTKQEQLADIDTNDIGEFIEDFGDATLNKAFGKFCIMDDQAAFEKVLTDELGYIEDEIGTGELDIVHKTVEETLKQVNLVFKNLGLDLEFKSADMVEYGAYMLTGKGDTPEDMGHRIRRLVDNKPV
jgi:hypothetical protein